ncbi:glycosyltransferase [Methylobacterium durans]|nr:glycosyltransferase family 4 protein [Methylobacterium durans]
MPESLSAMKGQWDLVDFIEPTEIKRQPKGEIFNIDDWIDAETIAEAERAIQQLQPDVILVNYVMYSKILDLAPASCVKLLDTHDKFGDRHLLLDRANIPRNFFWTSPDQEGVGLNRADIVVAIQETEASYFSEISSSEIKLLKHAPAERATTSRINMGLFGVIGSNNRINQKFYQQLVDEWVRSASPRMHLFVAGDVCGSIDVASQNVSLIGRVDDLDEFYSTIDIALNPLVSGSGLKIKTLEALEYRMPIISTREGMMGFNAVHPFHVLESVQELVACSKEIQEKPDLLSGLADASTILLAEYCGNWRSDFQHLMSSIERLHVEKANLRTI